MSENLQTQAGEHAQQLGMTLEQYQGLSFATRQLAFLTLIYANLAGQVFNPEKFIVNQSPEINNVK